MLEDPVFDLSCLKWAPTLTQYERFQLTGVEFGDCLGDSCWILHAGLASYAVSRFFAGPFCLFSSLSFSSTNSFVMTKLFVSFWLGSV